MPGETGKGIFRQRACRRKGRLDIGRYRLSSTFPVSEKRPMTLCWAVTGSREEAFIRDNKFGFRL